MSMGMIYRFSRGWRPRLRRTSLTGWRRLIVAVAITVGVVYAAQLVILVNADRIAHETWRTP